MEKKESQEEERIGEKEAPCNELVLFKASLASILTQVSSAVSLEKFTEIFKDIPPLANKPNRIKKTWEVFQQQMFEDMVTDVNEIIEDEDLNTKFMMLSQMNQKSNAAGNKVAWRPTLLSTDQYLRSYDMQLKMEKKKKLEEIAERKEQRVQELKKKVYVERAKANQISESIDRAREILKDSIILDLDGDKTDVQNAVTEG